MIHEIYFVVGYGPSIKRNLTVHSKRYVDLNIRDSVILSESHFSPDTLSEFQNPTEQ